MFDDDEFLEEISELYSFIPDITEGLSEELEEAQYEDLEDEQEDIDF